MGIKLFTFNYLRILSNDYILNINYILLLIINKYTR